MNLKEQMKALSDVLSPEQLTSLEDSIKNMVAEEVKIREEEKINELEKKADEYCEQEIAKRVADEKEALIEQYDEKLEELEDNIVEKVDQFLEMEIASQISDEAIEKVAINETFKPIVEGIQKLFEEKYVGLDTEGNKVLSEAKEQISDLKDQLDTVLAEKLEMAKLAETAAVKLKIAESTEDLTETQKERVRNFFEGKSFDEVDSKIGTFVDMVTESNDVNDDADEFINEVEENNFSDEDGEVETEINKQNSINEEEENNKYSNTIDTAQNFL